MIRLLLWLVEWLFRCELYLPKDFACNDLDMISIINSGKKDSFIQRSGPSHFKLKNRGVSCVGHDDDAEDGDGDAYV